MVQRGMPPKLLRSGALSDRLGAALEAIVIGDRWLANRRCGVDAAAGNWRGGLLQVARACAQGDLLLPSRWQPHFQTLPDTPALLLNALPYLWLQADAHGHHRAAVADWAAAIGQWRNLPRGESPAVVVACEVLFDLVCQVMAAAGSGPGWGHSLLSIACAPDGEVNPLEPVLRLVVQSQGEFAVVLGTAHQRGWAATEVALAGLVVGLSGGRAGLGASLRQRWLLAYPGAGQDGWQNLEADDLEAIALGLHCRWAGGEVCDRPEQPPFPCGIRV
ncbi:hypothetical protein IQ265_20355 [Nodosilinea sp. LEGE 06152]|uniref:hypothetical protein n=1 Tax=Nodosilinea sp. LEGE 06152 TaxID=2777966 RepID=UPI00187F9736|nr:hypothetical protein [Nodosilinea sp. LEGE 06152]MBE9159169.1 hypothetical protein [Nodosilinea sp. LEGE 06152]